MKIGVILDQIDLGSMALPEFQRGYVWNRDQVRDLMDPSTATTQSEACLFGPRRRSLQGREGVGCGHSEASPRRDSSESLLFMG